MIAYTYGHVITLKLLGYAGVYCLNVFVFKNNKYVKYTVKIICMMVVMCIHVMNKLLQAYVDNL